MQYYIWYYIINITDKGNVHGHDTVEKKSKDFSETFALRFGKKLNQTNMHDVVLKKWGGGVE